MLRCPAFEFLIKLSAEKAFYRHIDGFHKEKLFCFRF